MFCSAGVRRPLADLPIRRQMEHQNEKKFNNLVQDTMSRLQKCILLVETPENAENQVQRTNESSPEQSENTPSSNQDDVEAAKRRAKRAKKRKGAKLQDNEGPESNHVDENTNPNENDPISHIIIESYKDESQIGIIMELIDKELSEPYSIYTYRYFLNTWPELTLIAYDTRAKKYVGVIVCKVDAPSETIKSQCDDDQISKGYEFNKGYIAMLAVDVTYRGSGIGTRLVELVIDRMHKMGCDEIVLETEVSNTKALNLYSRLGFIREKKLFRYYLNNGDAFRLVLYRS